MIIARVIIVVIGAMTDEIVLLIVAKVHSYKILNLVKYTDDEI